jgi:hypothetical protein
MTTDIRQEQFANLVGGFGFEQYDTEAKTAFEGNVGAMLEKSIAASKMKGGSVTMPGEYFGDSISPSVYTSDGSAPIVSHVTDAVARPEIPQTFPFVGGAQKSIDDVFETALRQFRTQQGGAAGAKLRLKKEQKEAAKNYFRVMVNKVFEEVRKVAKKTKLLKGAQVKRAAKKVV